MADQEFLRNYFPADARLKLQQMLQGGTPEQNTAYVAQQVVPTSPPMEPNRVPADIGFDPSDPDTLAAIQELQVAGQPVNKKTVADQVAKRQETKSSLQIKQKIPPDVQAVLKNADVLSQYAGIPQQEAGLARLEEMSKGLKQEQGIPDISPLIDFANSFRGQKLNFKAPTPVYPQALAEKKLAIEQLIQNQREDVSKNKRAILDSIAKLSGEQTTGNTALNSLISGLKTQTVSDQGGGANTGKFRAFMNDFETHHKDQIQGVRQSKEISNLLATDTNFSTTVAKYLMAKALNGSRVSDKDFENIGIGDSDIQSSLARSFNKYIVGKNYIPSDIAAFKKELETAVSSDISALSRDALGAAANASGYGLDKATMKTALQNQYGFLDYAPKSVPSARQAVQKSPDDALLEKLGAINNAIKGSK